MFADLHYKISNSISITQIVTDRVYSDEAPENVKMPVLVYKVLSNEREHAMVSDPAMVTTTIQFDCMSNDRKQSRALAKALLILLRNHTGPLKAGGINVQSVLVLSEIESMDHLTKSKINHIDFEFKYEEV